MPLDCDYCNLVEASRKQAGCTGTHHGGILQHTTGLYHDNNQRKNGSQASRSSKSSFEEQPILILAVHFIKVSSATQTP